MKRKLRIGIDASALLIPQKNGYENYVSNLILALGSLPSSEFAGLELFIYFYAGNVLANSCLYKEIKPKLDKFHLRVYPFRWGFSQALTGMCGYDRLDLIHLPVYIWATKFPCRVITTFHDACPHRAFLDGLVDEEPRDFIEMINRQLHVSNAFIAVSNSSKRDLCEFYRIEDKFIHVVHHGVGDEFQPNPKAAEQVRNRYGLSNYILSVNAIQANKNYVRLLEAYADLINHGLLECDLVLVGRNGWGSDHIYKILGDLGLGKRVRLLGFVTQEELIGLYTGANLVVNASMCEGFGLPILEALACGAILAVSNKTAFLEVGGDAVFYFDPYDVQSISSVLYDALTNVEKRKTERIAGRGQLSKFSWEQTALKTLLVYKRTILKH